MRRIVSLSFLSLLLLAAATVTAIVFFGGEVEPPTAGPGPELEPGDGLFPVMVDGQWGYVDRTGQIAIKPQFEVAGDFHEGRAAIATAGLYGYRSIEGRLLIDHQFHGARPFSGGVAAVRFNRGAQKSWGYIDKTGGTVIAPAFDDAGPMRQSRARVRVGQVWGYIDGMGQWIIEPMFLDAMDFDEGFARVRTDEGWGIIDWQGRWAVTPRFAAIDLISEGTAAVLTQGAPVLPIDGAPAGEPLKQRQWRTQLVLTDMQGNVAQTEAEVTWSLTPQSIRWGQYPRWALNPEDADPQWLLLNGTIMRSGRLRVKIDGKWGFLNKEGLEAIPNVYTEASNFNEERAWVTLDAEHRGYINADAELIDKLPDGPALPFTGGLSAYFKQGRWGYVNRQSRFEIEPNFDLALPFHGGLAIVGIKKAGQMKYGLIDLKGEYVAQPEYDLLPREREVHLLAKSNIAVGEPIWTSAAEVYHISGDGRATLIPGAGRDSVFAEGLIAVREAPRLGFIDTKGQIVVAPQYALKAATDEESKSLAALAARGPGLFLDASGTPTLRRAWLDTHFAEGTAPVALPTGPFGYINDQGVFAIPPKFAAAANFHNGRARVRLKQGGPLGFIDPIGQMVIPTTFTWASDFSSGLASFRDGEHAGVIDQTGKRIIPARFIEPPSAFAEGFAVARDPATRRLQFIDREGKPAFVEESEQFRPALDSINGGFSEGIAPVLFRELDELTGQPQYAYINPKGEAVIRVPLELSDATPSGKPGVFQEWRAPIPGAKNLAPEILQKAGAEMPLYGFLDRQGRVVVPPTYHKVEPFRDGLARVWQWMGISADTEAWRFAYINRDGAVVWAMSDWQQ